MTNSSLSQTVIRALNILSLFKAKETMTLKEVVQQTELNTTIAYRLLQSLVSEQYLSYNEGSKEYSLGTEILILGHRAIDRQTIQQLAYPFMQNITAATGYGALLNIRAGTFSLCLEKVNAEAELDVVMRPGKVYPLHTGATSIVLLAFEEESFRTSYLQTLQNPEERDHVAQEVSSVRRQGYAFSVGRLTDGVFAVSFPLFDRSGRIAASLSAGGAAASLHEEDKTRLVEQVGRAAKSVNYLLGYEKG